MECLASDVTQVVVCGGFFQKQGDDLIKVNYLDLLDSIQQQLNVTTVFQFLLRIRQRLLKNTQCSGWPTTATLVDPLPSKCQFISREIYTYVVADLYSLIVSVCVM